MTGCNYNCRQGRDCTCRDKGEKPEPTWREILNQGVVFGLLLSVLLMLYVMTKWGWIG